MTSAETIGLGGGCHWCTEGIFQMLTGVAQVDQGFIRSDPPSGTWAEGVIVHFQPAKINLSILIEVHLRTHRATAPYEAESKYRSAIYTFDEEQNRQAIDAISALQRGFDDPIGTRVLPFREFRPSDDRFQNYYMSDPERPFCRRYIDPKLDFIRRNFAEVIASGGNADGDEQH
ncbi:MAG: peptide-methionine (S)-S-oxide reductase [Sphingomonas sp.]|jgi:peptide-methionine (S)-S-oxide reductase|uniref:peptide-methionine (S)-S-oxide reductase n=1 Tax=Sphingomonas sp. TaxID=28214 RepID=UPI003564E215